MENLILPKKPEQNHEPEEPVTMIGSFSLPFSMRQLVGTEELHFYQHEEFRSSRTPAEYHRDLLLALTQIVVQNNQRMQALKDGAKRSICDNCGDEFSSRSALFKHIKSSHDLTAIEIFCHYELQFAHTCSRISKFLHGYEFMLKLEVYSVDEEFLSGAEPTIVAEAWLEFGSTSLYHCTIVPSIVPHFEPMVTMEKQRHGPFSIFIEKQRHGPFSIFMEKQRHGPFSIFIEKQRHGPFSIFIEKQRHGPFSIFMEKQRHGPFSIFTIFTSNMRHLLLLRHRFVETYLEKHYYLPTTYTLQQEIGR
jgi:hypothetical protein